MHCSSPCVQGRAVKACFVFVRRSGAESGPGHDGVGAQQGEGRVRPSLNPLQTLLLLAVLPLHQSQQPGGPGQRGGPPGPGGGSLETALSWSQMLEGQVDVM